MKARSFSVALEARFACPIVSHAFFAASGVMGARQGRDTLSAAKFSPSIHLPSTPGVRQAQRHAVIGPAQLLNWVKHDWQ